MNPEQLQALLRLLGAVIGVPPAPPPPLLLEPPMAEQPKKVATSGSAEDDVVALTLLLESMKAEIDRLNKVVTRVNSNFCTNTNWMLLVTLVLDGEMQAQQAMQIVKNKRIMSGMQP